MAPQDFLEAHLMLLLSVPWFVLQADDQEECDAEIDPACAWRWWGDEDEEDGSERDSREVTPNAPRLGPSVCAHADDQEECDAEIDPSMRMAVVGGDEDEEDDSEEGDFFEALRSSWRAAHSSATPSRPPASSHDMDMVGPPPQQHP